ncbi:hypothetical protein Moror_14728 [Moniliophthora roreri MCA 2997]|uniref:NADH dehydrogenase [ubiquinone] 1 beta subcomplex subunit 4 n=1 Tax=Moniliophthora roreri (strain MCA 2997) TaxID=1381753 RepID=V2X6I2_MONRO|nr:hypothetical protein Moror_14728 [Moniliophthora roreri MCA 2997]
MGGHGHGALREDPAIEKFNTWREQHYLRFRWTRQNARIVVWAGLIVPVAMYVGIVQAQEKTKWWGARKTEKLVVSNKPESE